MEYAGFEAAVSLGKDGIYIAVHAQPGAKHPQLRGVHGEAIKLAISQAAQDGKANAALVRAIADGLNVSRESVEIASGLTSRKKRVYVHGDSDMLKSKLADWLEQSAG